MRYFSFGVLLVSFLLLSGCGVLPTTDLNAKRLEVEEYNSLVSSTLSAYTAIKQKAEGELYNLADFVLRGGENYQGVSLESLTEGELESFNNFNIFYNGYFTSVGADSVRQVLILKGYDKVLYVTVIWGTEDIHSVDRVVKDI